MEALSNLGAEAAARVRVQDLWPGVSDLRTSAYLGARKRICGLRRDCAVSTSCRVGLGIGTLVGGM